MSRHRNRRHRLNAALLILGSACPPPADAQDDPLPLPLPEGPAIRQVVPMPARRVESQASAPTGAPILRPTPVVVEIPPNGLAPTWSPGPIDPVVLEKKPPKHVARKVRSRHWRWLQGSLFGYPEEFEARPLGSSLYDFGHAMTANGAAARQTLFDYDFVQGTSKLNTRGRDQLSKIVAQLGVSPYPVLIERTPDNPALAASRKSAVLAELAAVGIALPPDRIFVGEPMPFGSSGTNAQIMGANMLNRTQQYGPPIPINSNGLNSPSGVTNSVFGTLPGQ
ncbi:hypothetical protein [Singulisphaera sp. PoT]|uniref:hypothetical protein n=1 Tax=Singulisphaera sp. PoT TaxID=3411797 RepID=UPI003BF50F76